MTRTNPKFTPQGDLVALAKPMITLMSVFMAWGGMALAPGDAPWSVRAFALLGTALAVASAHALNMVIERDTDALMERTRLRPLPDRRMRPATAVAFGAVTGVAGVAILALFVNGLTALLGAGALLLYAFVYTPLKCVTPLALEIGAVAGAMPPLMGWAAVTNTLDAPGLILFAIMTVWQLPHFIAITIYRRDEYARAGIRTTSVVHGERAAKIQALVWASSLVPLSILLVPFGYGSYLYLCVALALGLGFAGIAARGLRAEAGVRWAKGLFRASLAYLPLLTLGLVADHLMR